ncbi:MAG TPA: J domain-containing protein [Nannocystis sp.]
MPAVADHYAILGVSPSATTAEIRQAYRRRVALEHADRHAGDPRALERTRALNLARDVLLDPVRRARLDHFELARDPAPTRDPLVDTVARTFGAAPPPVARPSRAVRIDPAPGWLRGAGLGLLAAVTALGVGIGVGAAIQTANRERESDR